MTADKREQGKFDDARRKIEGHDRGSSDRYDKNMPAAGPHAKEEATNKEATPGAGSLPSTKPTDEVEPGTG